MQLQNTRTASDKLLLFIKGLAMGTANKVPGVSGGIVAFVTGFYEELIFSFKRINKYSFKLLISGRFKSFFQYTNTLFLLLIFSGSIFSYFSVSRILDYFLKHNELYVWSLFFGLILGSIYYIFKGLAFFKTIDIIAIVIGIGIGVLISLLPIAKENDNLWFVFLCGIIGVSGMIIPGLSGSFILMLLGNYVLLMVDSVNELFKIIADVFTGNFDFINNEERINYLKVLGSFTAGSIFGLIVLSNILAFILKRWSAIVTASILGFITGSLGNVWPWKEKIFKLVNNDFVLDRKGNKILENFNRYIPNRQDIETWYAVIFIIVGFSLLVLIEYYGRENKSTL